MRRGREEADAEALAVSSSSAASPPAALAVSALAAEPHGDATQSAFVAWQPAEPKRFSQDLDLPPTTSGIFTNRERLVNEQRALWDVQVAERHGALSSRSLAEPRPGSDADSRIDAQSIRADREQERAANGQRPIWERHAVEQSHAPFWGTQLHAAEQPLLRSSPIGSENGFHDAESSSEVRSIWSGAGVSERFDMPPRKQGSEVEVGRLGHADLIARARAVQRETTEAIERAKANAERKSWHPSEASWRNGHVAPKSTGQEDWAPSPSRSLMSITRSEIQKADKGNESCGEGSSVEPWSPSFCRSAIKLSQHDTGWGDKKAEQLVRREAWASAPLASPAKPAQLDVHWAERRLEEHTEVCGLEARPSSVLRPGSPLRIPSPLRSAMTTCLVQDRAPQRQRGWSPQPSRAPPLSPKPSLAYPPSPEEEQSHRSTLDSEKRGCHSRGQGSPGRSGQDFLSAWRIGSSDSLDKPSGSIQGTQDSIHLRLRKSPSESWSSYAAVGGAASAPSGVDEELRSSLSSQGSFLDLGSARAGVEHLGGRRQSQLNRSVSFEEPSSGSDSWAALATPHRHLDSAGEAGSLARAAQRPVCDRAGLSPRPFERASPAPGLGDRHAPSPRRERSAASINPLTSTLWKPTFRPSQSLLDSHRPRVLRDSHYGIGVR